MKTTFYLLTLALLLASCSQSKPVTETRQHTDSLRIGSQTIYIDSISANEFLRVKTPQANQNGNSDLVSVFPDSIVIKAAEKEVVYRNDTTEGDSSVSYEFAALIANPGYVHLKGSHWEWTTDRYVNLKTGVETLFWDNPTLSPNKQKLLAYSCDLEAGFMENGIQLYRIDSDTIQQVFEKELEDWGPAEMKWDSDTSLVVKRLRVDAEMNVSYDYLRLYLPED